MPPSVRCEQPDDIPAVRRVVDAAFRRPDAPGEEPPEVALLDELRADPAWIPSLSLVAVEDDVIGHIVCTRAHIDDVSVLGLGPIAVHPEHQRSGVGTALMNAVILAAALHGEAVIGLVGNPAFYGRFGFVPGRTLGIEPPDPEWGDAWQVLAAPGTVVPAGRFRYATPFGLD